MPHKIKKIFMLKNVSVRRTEIEEIEFVIILLSPLKHQLEPKFNEIFGIGITPALSSIRRPTTKIFSYFIG